MSKEEILRKEIRKIVTGICWNPYCEGDAECLVERNEALDQILDLFDREKKEPRIKSVKVWGNKEEQHTFVELGTKNQKSMEEKMTGSLGNEGTSGMGGK